jgi:hypothetical protein
MKISPNQARFFIGRSNIGLALIINYDPRKRIVAIERVSHCSDVLDIYYALQTFRGI